MGYDLRITRNPEPDWDNLDPDDFDGGISAEEWSDYVSNDPSLRPDGFAEAHGPNGESLRVIDDGIAVWTEHPTATSDTGFAWIHHRNGEIFVKQPDQEFLAKMLAIASDLDAVVVGDDGEQYTSPDSHGILPSVCRAATPPITKPWWRFW